MIRLFISSTFPDMKEEREMLHQVVYPELRRYGLSKGIPVDICDLRWGIDIEENDEDELIGKVMDVCFKEIQQCDPYIIAMIGKRYGTKTEDAVQAKIESIWSALNRADDLPEERGLSLTQWELEYSFLSKQNPDVRALCLFKKLPGRSNKNVSALKRKIAQKHKENPGSVRIKKYAHNDRLNEFCEIIQKNVRAFIDEKSEKDTEINPAAREFASADAYCTMKSAFFGGRDHEADQCRQFIKDGKFAVLGVDGQSGSGKSTLLAKAYKDLVDGKSRKEKINCKFIACGASEHSNDYLNLMKQITFALEECLYGEETKYRDDLSSEELVEKAYKNAVSAINENDDAKGLVLFIDAMDKINASSRRGKKNFIIETLLGDVNSKQKVRLVCSQIKPFRVAHEERFSPLHLQPLGRDQATDILRKKLFSDQQETDPLGNIVVQEILEKKDNGEPLYLDVLISYLKMHISDAKTARERDQYYASLVKDAPETTAGLCWYVLNDAIDYLQLDKNRLLDGIAMIAASSYGLRATDLEKILNDGWSPLDFSRLYKYLYGFFRYQHSGFWVFEHDIIADGIRNGLQEGYRYERSKRQLYEYLLGRKCWDRELISREALKLNMDYCDYSTAGILLWKLTEFHETDETEKYKVWTTAANETDLLTQREEGKNWYAEVVKQNEMPMIRFLRCLLELNQSEDYPRQYPAKLVTDLFWNVLELDVRVDGKAEDVSVVKPTLQERIGSKGFDDQFQISLFITEYANICESISEHMMVAGCIDFALSFFLKDDNIRRMNKEQRFKSFKSVNSLFFTNNRILHVLKSDCPDSQNIAHISALSKQVIDGFDSDLFGVRRTHDAADLYEVRRLESMYISNIGQYNQALRDWNQAMAFHLRSLTLKAGLFLDISRKRSRKREFIRLCGTPANSGEGQYNTLIKAIDIGKHREFWREVGQEISDKNARRLSEHWRLLGVGYRNLAWDIFMATQREEDEELLEIGCASMEQSIEMLCNEKFDIIIREQMLSQIRSTALRIRQKDISQAEMKHIITSAIKTMEQYKKYALYLGESEGENLRKNATNVINRAEQEKLYETKELKRLRKELEETAAEIEKQNQ